MEHGIYSENQKKLRSLLRQARKNSGTTQKQLAHVLNKPQSFISKYERGERVLNSTEWIEIAEVLGVDATEIIAGLKKDIR